MNLFHCQIIVLEIQDGELALLKELWYFSMELGLPSGDMDGHILS